MGEEQMQDGLGSLLVTCACMFFGAAAAGMLPAILPVSDAKMRLVNAAGAGLLVGSALCIILPEGFEAFSEAQEHIGDDYSMPEQLQGLMLLLGFTTMLVLDAVSHRAAAAAAKHRSHTSSPDTPNTPDQLAAAAALDRGLDDSNGGDGFGGRLSGSEANGAPEVAAAAAAALLPGCSGHSHGTVTIARGAGPEQAGAAEQALWGLLVHSAADGLAVGAVALSPNLAVALSVGAAMVLHKGPVAFGLVSYLQASGWALGRVQRGLLLFASTSPAAAVATYLLLRHVPFVPIGASVALAVLFSGGTFLYAACIHIFPQSVLRAPNANAGGVLVAATCASFLPLLFAALVPHHH